MPAGCPHRKVLQDRKAEEAAAAAALEEGRAEAAETGQKARDSAEAAGELRAEVEQLREQFATGDQSVQVRIFAWCVFQAAVRIHWILRTGHYQSKKCKYAARSGCIGRGTAA